MRQGLRLRKQPGPGGYGQRRTDAALLAYGPASGQRSAGGGERARYDAQLLNRLGERLAQEFGRGFEARDLRRMVQFSQAFADTEIVASLMRQLSWTHFLQLLHAVSGAKAEDHGLASAVAVSARWGCARGVAAGSPWPPFRI